MKQFSYFQHTFKTLSTLIHSQFPKTILLKLWNSLYSTFSIFCLFVCTQCLRIDPMQSFLHEVPGLSIINILIVDHLQSKTSPDGITLLFSQLLDFVLCFCCTHIYLHKFTGRWKSSLRLHQITSLVSEVSQTSNISAYNRRLLIMAMASFNSVWKGESSTLLEQWESFAFYTFIMVPIYKAVHAAVREGSRGLNTHFRQHYLGVVTLLLVRISCMAHSSVVFTARK